MNVHCDLDTNNPDAAVVLLSGGLDSTVALAETLLKRSVACVLTMNYGQRAFLQELRATQAIAAHYGLFHRVVALPWLAELLPRALTPSAVLAERGESIEESPALSPEALMDVHRVWVPNRNGLFLNIAACFAEAMDVPWVVFGANREEGESFPDNTPAFREQLNHLFAFSTLKGVHVETPVGHLDKAQIIQRGLELNVPFHLVWSCYENGDAQCGECPSCVRVRQAQALVEQSQSVRVALNF